MLHSDPSQQLPPSLQYLNSALSQLTETLPKASFSHSMYRLEVMSFREQGGIQTRASEHLSKSHTLHCWGFIHRTCPASEHVETQSSQLNLIAFPQSPLLTSFHSSYSSADLLHHASIVSHPSCNFTSIVPQQRR